MANPRGNPTKYKRKYCKMLLETMSKGNSVVNFCASIGISRDTFYEWVKCHKEYSDTWKRAATLCESYWENIGKKGVLDVPVAVDKEGKERKVNPAMYKFYMANRFRWSDRVEQEITADVTGSVSMLSPEERKKRIEELCKKAKNEP
jgi:transposase-like protein